MNLEDLTEEEQSEDICLIALEQNKKGIHFIKNRKRLSENFWSNALKIDGMLLFYYLHYSSLCKKEINDEIIKIALKQNSASIQFLKTCDQTEEYWILAVSRNGLELKWCTNQTLSICEAAIKENPKAIQYASIQTEDMKMIAANHDGLLIQYMTNITSPIAMAAVKQNGFALIIIQDRFYSHKWMTDYNSKSQNDKYVICYNCCNVTFEIYEASVNQNFEILNSKKIHLYEFRKQYCDKYDIDDTIEEDGFGLFD